MTKPRRVPYRPVRPLWVFVALIVLIFVGVCVWVFVPIYRERVARSEIERVGGRIEIRRVGAWADTVNSEGRKRSTFVEVALNDSQATDATLAYLDALPELESLLLDNTSVTDAGLRQLNGLTGLEH